MASITTTYRDLFRAHDDCDPVCRKSRSYDEDEQQQQQPECLVYQQQQGEEEEEEAEEGCCPQGGEAGEAAAAAAPPCSCGEDGGGGARCAQCTESLREVAARDVMWPRRKPLTYYAKVFKEYPFMLKMYGEHHSVGIEVEPEDLLSVYMTDYGADKKPVPLERKGDPPRPDRTLRPFLHKEPTTQWTTSVDEQIPWKLSDCPLTLDELLLCQRRPRGCQSCGCYT